MLSLKFAHAFVELSLNRKQYDRDVLRMQRDLAKIPGKVTIDVALNAAQFRKGMIAVRQELAKLKTYTIAVRVDRARVTADLNLIRQQAQAMQRRSFGTIPIRADLRPWRTAIKSVAFDLYRIRRFAAIPIGLSGISGAHANLNLLMAHMKAMQGLGKTKVSVGGGRGGLGGGGGGFGSGGGFLSGVGMGLGLPFATSPQMMAGQMLGGGIRGGIATAAGLQTQTAELRRVSGMGAGQAQGFKQGLFGLGTSQAGVSIDDLMEISQLGGRAGVADREGPGGLLTFTKDLAMVKNAVADMPTEELAESMVKVLNVFELGTDRVAGFGSALTAMDNVSVASARDILNITTRLSGTAQAIGMTLPQITAFSSVLKDVGLSNEVAGTAFSQVFRKMATDSANFAQQIGVDAKTFADAYRRDPMEALSMVISKFNEMKDSIEGQEFLADLGLEGARVTGGLQQLASKFDEVGKRAAIASAETGTLNALMAANALKSDTLEASYVKLKNALVELGDAMGAPMLGPATDAVRAMTGLTKAAAQGNFAMLLKSGMLGVGGNPLVQGMLGAGGGFASGLGGQMGAMQGSLEEDMLRRLFGDSVASAGKPIAAGAGALPAAKPQLVGPPNVNRDPNAGANLLAQGQNRLSNLLAAIMDTRQSLLGVGGKALGQLATGVVGEKKKERTFSSGLSGEEVGRQLQNDILNMTKDKSGEETAKNTRKANEILAELKAILQRGGQQIGAAVLGQ